MAALSLEKKTVFTRAFCIIPPQNVTNEIQKIRQKYDKQVNRWMPHINLIYPFLDEGADLSKLRDLVASTPAFKITLDRFGFFSMQDNHTLWLRPDSSSVLEQLHPRLVNAASLPPPKKEFHPHLTVGQFADDKEVANVQRELQASWRSLSFIVTHIHVISRGQSDPEGKRSDPEGKQSDPGSNGEEPFTIQESLRLASGVPKEEKEKLAEKKANTEIQASFIPSPLGDKISYARIVIPSSQLGSFVDRSSRQILVLDKSGSMAGRPWACIQSTVQKIHQGVRFGQEPIYVMYGNAADVFTYEQVRQGLPNESTNFTAALYKVMEIVMKMTESTISVIFMTDGEDTCSTAENLTRALSSFRTMTKNLKKVVAVNVLGLGRNHDVDLLKQLRVVGNKEGLYQFADDNESLDTKLQELFCIADQTIGVQLLQKNGEASVSLDAERSFDAEGQPDGFEVEIIDQDLKIDFAKECTLQIQKSSILIEWKAIHETPIIAVKRLARRPLTTQQEVSQVQKDLGVIPLFGRGMTKEERQTLSDMKLELQARLDKAHELFANVAKSNSQGVGTLAKLNDLRYEAKFSKVRRQRAMNVRLSANAKKFNNLDDKLKALPLPTEEDFKGVDLDTFTCDLSYVSAQEMMTSASDFDDVLGFCLNVNRPEHVIDAPTMIVLVEPSTTFCCRSVIETAIQHKISLGGEAAGGTFFGSKEKAHDVPTTSVFVGRSREPINAMLPLYVCEAHWRRVQLLIEPLIGYFFTLDPLGFHEAQILGLFSVLGQLVLQFGKSDREKLILEHFAKVCEKLLPRAIKLYEGKDLVEAFINDPEARGKGSVQNLLTAVGWALVTKTDLNRLYPSLISESYRRQVQHHYSGHANIDSLVEKLLYGPEDEKSSSLEEKDVSVGNKNGIDEKFADWAKYKLRLSKHHVADPIDVIQVKMDAKEKVIQAASLVQYRDMTTSLETPPLLKLIEYFKENKVDTTLSDETSRAMLIQSLRYLTNEKYNQASQAKQIYDPTRKEGQQKIIEEAHTRLHEQAKLAHQSVVDARKNAIIASLIVKSKNWLAFIGRMMTYCPTRGGQIYENVVSQLSDASLQHIPLRLEKITLLITGWCKFEDKRYSILSEGNFWIPPTAVMDRFTTILGQEVIDKIELLLRGTMGVHVYRSSNIPNRHGHSNLNPNVHLRFSFAKFAKKGK